MERELRPRLCYLIKGMQGYGFHLHGERNKGGQIIRTVDPGSSADLGGLRAGDRVVEVNGENVESQTHHQVVDRIREVPHRTRLLVVDKETEDYLLSHGLACTEDIAIEMGTLSPRPSPMSTPSASPIPRETSPLLIKSKHSLMLRHSSVGSTISISTSILKRSSMMSSSTTDTELQVEPSPEPSHELLPRLCHLLKGEQGFGFNLQSDKKKKSQFVLVVDPCSPAYQAGVRAGDRIVEVHLNFSHFVHFRQHS
ncbi:Na(+)/H(+) exchange regulatory cofactor NHE-RF2-like [Gouania willdenowi]|uniref:Na(+)/H(+) exchange regulatory cofactor NHE-RF2-like n=1 Tax=Gouania willdenowi TaxID=441366 RepID=UPI0010543C4B|nr:Na(+)/H(+) exchange regulatory cofactor NHE-RF2-like [Gouania willdenowi]